MCLTAATDRYISPFGEMSLMSLCLSEYVQRFATKEAADAAMDQDGDEDEDEEMSDVGSISDDEEA